MRLPTPALAVLIGAALVVLVGLGVWQLQRNDWKHGLVTESHQRTEAAPVAVTDASTETPDEIAYHRVRLEGAWRLEDALFLANRARYSVRGEEILLPMQPPSGPAVLVNLGWIPDGAREDVMATLAGRTDEPIEGLAVDASGRNGHRIPSGSWSNIDPETMSESLGYELADWYVLAGPERTSDPSPNEPLPVAGWRRYQNTTPHVEYALTWFGLAAALAAAAVFRLVIAPRREARKGAPTDGTRGPSGPPRS
ncbi:MAG: SURF1 family protein [Dehalococcoidia bacterium]